MFVRLRQAVGRGPLADLFACFYCLSLWVSAPVALLMASGLKETIVAWPALSAGAILINRVAERYG
jgi:hypothetical protein